MKENPINYDYLIIPKDSDPFLTNYYDYLNNYQEGMIVIKTWSKKYSKDGIYFQKLKEDSL